MAGIFVCPVHFQILIVMCQTCSGHIITIYQMTDSVNGSLPSKRHLDSSYNFILTTGSGLGLTSPDLYYYNILHVGILIVTEQD